MSQAKIADGRPTDRPTDQPKPTNRGVHVSSANCRLATRTTDDGYAAPSRTVPEERVRCATPALAVGIHWLV